MRQASSSPFMWARSASGLIESPRRSRSLNGDAVQLQRAGLDLGEVEDVVDHGQQRLGRFA